MHNQSNTPAISPLRQRLIDDMKLRHFGHETQRNYLRDVGRLASFLGRLAQPHKLLAVLSREEVTRLPSPKNQVVLAPSLAACFGHLDGELTPKNEALRRVVLEGREGQVRSLG